MFDKAANLFIQQSMITHECNMRVYAHACVHAKAYLGLCATHVLQMYGIELLADLYHISARCHSYIF